MAGVEESQSLLSWFQAGGFVMYPLLIFSFLIWGVIFERFWRFRRLRTELKSFHGEAIAILLRKDREALERLCRKNGELPTSQLLTVALERSSSNDERVRARWKEAVERRRLMANQDFKKNLWVLGTIATASPFVGLFGTVVGILRSFYEIGRTGVGGFAVVASGISEALVATAAGILVAVIASLAYNAFQTRFGSLALLVRLQIEEFLELLAPGEGAGGEG